jgi:hypothetical protein
MTMRRGLIRGFVLLTLLLVPISAVAQSGPLSATPTELTLTGTVDQGPLAASLRLMAEEAVTGVELFASDLADVTGDNRTRDSIPASAVTLLPDDQFETLDAGSLTQVVVQVSPPAKAGTYTGTLTIRWREPSQGQLVIPLTVEVRTRPNLALLDPAQVTIAGRPGQEISRRVTLRETVGGSPLTGLEAISQDLRTADGERVLPATAISLTLPTDQIDGEDIEIADLEIDLGGVSPGAYAGQVHLAADEGNLVSLPVTVNVRARLFLPILVVLVGTALGFGLSVYRDRGKPRDQVILRVTAIRRAMEEDEELEAGFGPRLKAILREVEAHLRAERWEEARQAASQAEAIVRKWGGEAREEWVKQLTYLREELLPRLEDGEAWTLRKLRQEAQEVQRAAADLKDPAELRNRLLDIERDLELYEMLDARLEAIAKARMDAPVDYDVKEGWQRRERELAQRLNRLLPEEDGWDQLGEDIRSLAQEISDAVAAAPDRTKGAAREAVVTYPFQVPSDLRVPQARSVTIASEAGARRRLWLHQVLKYGLGGLVSVVTGLSTLYLANPTFGAEPVGDYLSLLVWGLGAQTTFASAVDLLKSLDVPFGGGA